MIDRVTFGLTTTNEWPLELAIQIYFLDENYVEVGLLFEDQTALLEAAPVNSDGELDRTSLEPNSVAIQLTQDDFSDIEEAKYLMLEAKVVTTNDGASSVKFYSQYLLSYKLSIDAAFRINPSELNF